MKRTHLALPALASLAACAWLACSFPTVTYGTPGDAGTDATTTDDGAADAAEDAASHDAAPDVPLPDFPDGDPDAYNACDQDHDLYRSVGCANGPDCNDLDPRVSPAQTNFLTDVPDAYPNGDWNCDKTVELQYPKVQCSLACTGEGFATNVACGKTGNYVKCNGVVALCGTTDAGTRVQGCR